MASDEEKDLAERWANGVWGETEADRIRHSQARPYFLTLLSKHLDDKGIFFSWGIQAGIVTKAQECKQAVMYLQKLRSENAPPLSLRIAKQEAQARVDALLATLNPRGIYLVSDLANRYVREQIGVSWDWLAIELTSLWLVGVIGWATNESYVKKFSYIENKPPAPQVTFHFESEPNEAYVDMLERFEKETKTFLKEQADNFRKLYPKGRLLSSQDVERYVEWFFRLSILKESPRHIGEHEMNKKEKLPKTHIRGKSDVKDQADIARQWLSLGFTKENLEETISKELGRDFALGEDELWANFSHYVPPENLV